MARRTIAGRVIAVTGAARGIGAAIAAALAGRGARVALGDVDGDQARDTARALPGDARGLTLDVTDDSSFAAFLDATEEQLGRLDVLVNNAGIMWVGPFAEEPAATAIRQFDVNLHGVMRGMKLAIPRMRARGHGHVINVASAASKLTPAGEATYAATKHAVYGYTAAVREELRGSGIELTLIMPAVVETELAVGTSAGKARRLDPADVGQAVVGALERPRLEVFVPASLGLLARAAALLPQRGRDALSRALVPDQLRATERSARAAYEARAVAQGPGSGQADPAREPGAPDTVAP